MRAALAPRAPFVERLLATWRAADRAWAEAQEPAALRDALATQWACRLLFDIVREQERALPRAMRLAAIADGLVALDDAVAAVALLGDDLESAWSDLLRAAGDDIGALERVIAAMDASGADAGYAELDAIELLIELGRVDAALERLPRPRWPHDRVRAVEMLAPELDRERRLDACDAAWDAVRAASHPALEYRVSWLAELIALYDAGGPGSRRLERACELAALVESLPDAALGLCPDHRDLRSVAAVALAEAGDVAGALAWADRIPADLEGAWGIADIAEALSEPERTALARTAIARCREALRGPDVEIGIALALAGISPEAGEAVAAEVGAGPCAGLEVALARVQLAVHAPQTAPAALDALDALLGAEAAAAEIAPEALDAVAAAAGIAPERAGPLLLRLTDLALALGSELDPYDLPELAERAPAVRLEAVLAAIERAEREADGYRVRTPIRGALVRLTERLDRSRPDLAARVDALAERLSIDLAVDSDPELLALVPPAGRRAAIVRALGHVRLPHDLALPRDAPAPAAPEPEPEPEALPTLEELERLDALGTGDDPDRRGSAIDGELWKLARAWWTRGEFERARAVLPRFGWWHYRDLCAVELACATGDEDEAERALARVLEPPAFYTTPSQVAAYAARVPGALYRVAARAPSPGLREVLLAHLLDRARDPAAWAAAGIDPERVRAELEAGVLRAIDSGGEDPEGAVALAFPHLSPEIQRRAWGRKFGAPAGNTAGAPRWKVYLAAHPLEWARALVGAEVAPMLAAIEARLAG